VRKPVVLITGAGGEIGHALVAQLSQAETGIITLDVNPLDPKLAPLVRREFLGSITDSNLLDRMLAEFEVDCVFHLAALLSTRSEFTPLAAHQVNVGGTLNLLEFAQLNQLSQIGRNSEAAFVMQTRAGHSGPMNFGFQKRQLHCVKTSRRFAEL